MKVYAVIVTFNRIDLLKQCLAATTNQSRKPDCIVVIDNASSDGTKEYLEHWKIEEPNIRIALHFDRNTGGSGGFYRGIELACRLGANWVWVMDDDSLPESNCLEQLLNAGDIQEIGFLAPLVRWKDGSICLSNPTQADGVNWATRYEEKKPIIKVLSASFVGLLVHRDAVLKVGLPVPEFFIWYDDIEYTLRITRALQGFCVPSAVVNHLIPENSSPGYSKVNEKNLWKHQYGIRNETAVTFRTRRFGFLRSLLLWAERNREMRIGNAPLSVRIRVLAWAAKGMLFRYQKKIRHLN